MSKHSVPDEPSQKPDKSTPGDELEFGRVSVIFTLVYSLWCQRRGYDVTLVSDAHTTENRTAWGLPPPEQGIAFTNIYWAFQTAPGRTAATVATKNLEFGLKSASQ